MGKEAKRIASVDVENLIKILNSALAEEWLAYYQYWIGAKVMEGPMRTEVEPELLVHATQELNHAVMVADRIIQLGGTPLLHPQDWFKHSGCDYDAPNDPYIEAILEQNLKGERCAIRRYNEIATLTAGKDHMTHKMATQILAEEIEHENDIEDWLTDIERLKDEIKKLRM